jgi:hypothetical protein
MRWTIALVALTVSALSDIASSEPIDDWICRAREAHVEKKPAEVGRCLGKAAARAHARVDLAAETRVALEIRHFVWGRLHTRVSSKFEDAERSGFLAGLVPLMSELDPRRGGVFVSAHDIAYEILAIGTRTGNRTGLKEALEAARRWRRAGHAGKFGVALQDYAEGVLALQPGGKPRKGLASLTRALIVCKTCGWREMGAFISCEIACAHLALGDRKAAVAALDAAAWTVVGRQREGEFWQRLTMCMEVKRLWREMLEARVGPTDRKLQARFTKALAGVDIISKGDSGQRQGGMAVGGSHVKAGDRALLLERIRTGQSLLTISRKGDALKLSSLGGAQTKEVGILDGQAAWSLAGAQVHTYFANVSVHSLDFEAIRKGGAGGSYRDEARCWYLLAPGERLTLTKGGVKVR